MVQIRVIIVSKVFHNCDDKPTIGKCDVVMT
jgi:hypothetical protein